MWYQHSVRSTNRMSRTERSPCGQVLIIPHTSILLQHRDLAQQLRGLHGLPTSTLRHNHVLGTAVHRLAERHWTGCVSAADLLYGLPIRGHGLDDWAAEGGGAEPARAGICGGNAGSWAKRVSGRKESLRAPTFTMLGQIFPMHLLAAMFECEDLPRGLACTMYGCSHDYSRSDLCHNHKRFDDRFVPSALRTARERRRVRVPIMVAMQDCEDRVSATQLCRNFAPCCITGTTAVACSSNSTSAHPHSSDVSSVSSPLRADPHT